MKAHAGDTGKGPVEVVKQGNVRVPIYQTVNRIYRREQGTGERRLIAEHPQFTVAFYAGARRVKRKFTDLARARAEALNAAIRLAGGETEALKLTGLDRATYVEALRQLREWKPSITLTQAVSDHIRAARCLPDGVSLDQAVSEYLRRHPAGLPQKTVPQVVDELVSAKKSAGRSDEYAYELEKRLGRFARSFAVPIGSVTGRQIGEWIHGLGLSGRSQNNFRRIINTFFQFAKRRGYLPRDWDEMSGVERADDDSGDIEVFSPAELRRLLAACAAPVVERGVPRTREEMIPYLTIAAFAGLRSAEIARLDWSEIHLCGPERFIEVKAAKSKTASRRIVPVTDNLAAWLGPQAQSSGPVVPFSRRDKQLYQFLAPTAGIEWKRNGLRHSFISYRLALIKNVHQVSLEAGNSAQMVFQHYRQLVTETAAREWFGLSPLTRDGAGIIPLPAAAADRGSAPSAVAGETVPPPASLPAAQPSA
ncbi:MAG: hypothetical protein FJ387_12055 [Verrucomicrobia bacterium]|nr:hypothetical protein [Verrucomicrobiota bacterium]